MVLRLVTNSLKLPFSVSRSLCSSSVLSSTKMATNLDDDDCVLFSTHGRKGVITLNRPKQLNALNHPMVLKIYPKLQEWKNTKDLILVKGNSVKAFCAGGDVVSITRDKTGKTARDYFRSEYLNNGMVASLQVPYVALINGIVMGGGVGISIHGKYRVGTETSLFAMPETQIGLFPDVGVSHFLSRMPYALGPFLALTGYRLKGFDLYHAGIATHFCLSEFLPELESELLKDNSNVDNVLQEFHSKSIERFPNSKDPVFSLAENLELIGDIFSASNIEDIINGLQKRGDNFSNEILKLLSLMSPLSLKVTLRQIQVTTKLDVYETLNQDYRLAWKLLAENDFYEGVRALLVDKDKSPNWKPEKLGDITEETVAEFFKPIDPKDELNLPNSL